MRQYLNDFIIADLFSIYGIERSADLQRIISHQCKENQCSRRVLTRLTIDCNRTKAVCELYIERIWASNGSLYRPRVENKSFSIGNIWESQESSQIQDFFWSTDGWMIELQQSSLSNKARWLIICRSIDKTFVGLTPTPMRNVLTKVNWHGNQRLRCICLL